MPVPTSNTTLHPLALLIRIRIKSVYLRFHERPDCLPLVLAVSQQMTRTSSISTIRPRLLSSLRDFGYICAPLRPSFNPPRTMSNLLEPFVTRVHYYPSPTPYSTAYEVGPDDAPNALIAIGGLGDGPHTVPAMRKVAGRIDGSQGGPAYSMFEIRMRSSFIGFGTSSLAEDVVHISCLVKYLRGLGKKKIVLMGHSTGCQVCLSRIQGRRFLMLSVKPTF